MEKTQKLQLVQARFLWDDVGDWASLDRLIDPIDEGTVKVGEGSIHQFNASENIVFTSKDMTVGLIAVKDLVVVSTPSHVLVCPKDKAQDVKKLLRKMEKEK